MAIQDDGISFDELFDLLDVVEATDRSTSPPSKVPPAKPASVTTMLPGPPMIREDLAREILDDLRTHGVVAGNRAVEVIRAVSAMLSVSDGGRRSGECLIAAIARSTGLQVKILNGTLFPDGPVDP